MAEWLRRQIRNLVGSTRGGSNPPAVVYALKFYTILMDWIALHCISLCRIYTRVSCDNRFNAWMAEWSKAADLSSVIFGCVGSNPTSGKFQRNMKLASHAGGPEFDSRSSYVYIYCYYNKTAWPSG